MKNKLFWIGLGGLIGGLIGYVRACYKLEMASYNEDEEEYDEEWEQMTNVDHDMVGLDDEYNGIHVVQTANRKYSWEKPALDLIVDENGYRNYSQLSRSDTPLKESPISNVMAEEETVEKNEEESESVEMEEENIEQPVEVEEGIVIIDEDSFNNGYPLDNKIGLYYYEGDDVLTDEDGEVIDDVEEAIGDEALSEFGNEYPDMVHVRNGFRGVCYEITRLHKEYHRFN